MQIDHYDFGCKNGEHCVFGLNIAQREDRINVNLFELDENGHEKVGDHIWGLTRNVLDTVLQKKFNRKDISWTLTTGYHTSDIQFHELLGQPYQMSISDMYAMRFGPSPNNGSFSIDRYSEEYSGPYGKPIHKSDLELDRGIDFPKEPKDVFAVPCPSAKDGIFYCCPEIYQNDTGNRYQCMLVDTRKLIERVGHDDPDMLGHARYKFSGETPEGWLEYNSPQYPYNTGKFTTDEYVRVRSGQSPGVGISMITGNAGMFILAEKLGLPFLPIQVGTCTDPRNIAVIKEQLSYVKDNRNLTNEFVIK